jgi:hypothetical protein
MRGDFGKILKPTHPPPRRSIRSSDMTKEQGKIKQIPPFSSESFRAYGSRTVGDSLLGQVCGTTRYGGNTTSHNQPPPSSVKHYFSHNQDQEARREPPPPVASPRRKGLGRASSRKHVAAWQAALGRKPGLGTRCQQGFRPPLSGSHPPLSAAQDAHSARARKDGLLLWAVGSRIQLARVRKGVAGGCNPTVTNLRGELKGRLPGCEEHLTAARTGGLAGQNHRAGSSKGEIGRRLATGTRAQARGETDRQLGTLYQTGNIVPAPRASAGASDREVVATRRSPSPARTARPW